MVFLVAGLICRDRGASFRTMETVDAENPLSRATSARVTGLDLLLRGVVILQRIILTSEAGACRLVFFRSSDTTTPIWHLKEFKRNRFGWGIESHEARQIRKIQ